jgi:hypothetical protein
MHGRLVRRILPLSVNYKLVLLQAAPVFQHSLTKIVEQPVVRRMLPLPVHDEFVAQTQCNTRLAAT